MILNPFADTETRRLGLPSPDVEISLVKQFAQCGEDYLVLSMLRSLATREGLDLEKETYCEIGAYHAVAGSSTYLLHQSLGMKGVLVEANPELIDNLQKGRPHDEIVHRAIVPPPPLNTQNTDNKVEIYISEIGELTSLDKNFAPGHKHFSSKIRKSVIVPAQTLHAFMGKYFGNKAPLFLSLDIEGLDRAVLESYNFFIRPFIIQIESSEDDNPEDFIAIKAHLEKHHYQIIARTDVNQIAVDLHRINKQIFSSIKIDNTENRLIFDGVKILSLDIFDTVLARKTHNPTDVFFWMEKALNLQGFANDRINAEQETRKQFSNRGAEVSLDEIYWTLQKIRELPDTVKQAEIAAEKLFLYANPFIIDLIKRARAKGIRVIAVSDIYLSSTHLETLLSHVGIKVDHIYASSDYREQNYGKYNGTIYPHIAEIEKVKPNEMLHVGDNKISDILNAEIAGLRTLHSEHLATIVKETEPIIASFLKDASKPTQRIITGQIVHKRIQAPHQLPLGYAFGYNYGGSLLLGFIQFIVRQAKKDNIDCLLLLERDGFIIEEALKILNINDISTRLIPSSRRMAIFPCLVDGGYERIKRLFEGHKDKMTEEEFFNILSLDSPHTSETNLTTLRTAKQHFDHHENYLLTQAKQERDALLLFLQKEQQMLNEQKKLAWVDVGWSLSSATALNEILQKDIPCYCVGSTSSTNKQLPNAGYLFTQGEPDTCARVIMCGVELIELVFSSPQPQTAFVKQDNNTIIRHHVQKNHQSSWRDSYITGINQGSLDFIKDIKNLRDGIDEDDLLIFNQQSFATLCSAPNPELQHFLQAIPHDRFPGDGEWRTIGDYWNPPLKILTNQTSTNSENINHHKIFKKLLIYIVLNATINWLPLPSSMRKRFVRSMHKRNLIVKQHVSTHA